MAKDKRPRPQRKMTGQVQGPKSPFQTLCRQLFALLKIVHHHEVMLNSKTQGLPRAFQQKVAELAKFLKPAHPNSALATELQDLAKIWGFSVRDRLLEHYGAEIKKIESAIQATTADISEQFETATQVALNWGKNRMGKKLATTTKSTFLALAKEVKGNPAGRRRHNSGPPTLSENPQTPREVNSRTVGSKAKRDIMSPETLENPQATKRAPAMTTPPPIAPPRPTVPQVAPPETTGQTPNTHQVAPPTAGKKTAQQALAVEVPPPPSSNQTAQVAPPPEDPKSPRQACRGTRYPEGQKPPMGVGTHQGTNPMGRATPLKRTRGDLTPTSASSPSPTPAPKAQCLNPSPGTSPDFSWSTITPGGRRRRSVRLTELQTGNGELDSFPTGTPEAFAGPHDTTPSARSVDLNSTTDFPPIPLPKRVILPRLSPRKTHTERRENMLKSIKQNSPQKQPGARTQPPQKVVQEDRKASSPVPAEVYKHPSKSYTEKFSDWQIREPRATTKTLILGDSNMSRISLKPNKDIEIQAFHGGRVEHMVAMLTKFQKRAPDSEIDNVILAMGTNDTNSNSPIGKIERDIKRMNAVAKSKFPLATIVIPEVITTSTSTPQFTKRAQEINKVIQGVRSIQSIPRPPANRVTLEAGDKFKVHWSRDSANMILKHWNQALN